MEAIQATGAMATPLTSVAAATPTTTVSTMTDLHTPESTASHDEKPLQPTGHLAGHELHGNGNGFITPTSPPFPPNGTGGPMFDPAQLAGYSHHRQPQPHPHPHPHPPNGFEPHEAYAYVYPLSPQFSVQYYADFGNAYQSFPGSPALHPQSPPVNPTSPPFSPTFQYQQGPGITLSPPTHAYVLPHSAQHHFPPLHISSPVLTGAASVPGSPPFPFIQPLPAPFAVASEYPYAHGRQPSDTPAPQAVHHSHNIYVRGLPPSTTDESFAELCAVYGTIASSKAIIDQKTGECKGYGFTMYENPDDCHKAIQGLNNAGFQASFARVGQESFSSRLRSLQDETSTNIYISNLPLDMTEQKLQELFQPYKTVSNRILRDPQSGISRGVGFARLADRASAIAIIQEFNGKAVPGSSAPLQVRFADSPAQKKLKHQTARKRMIRPSEFQPMAGFPVRPIMPITPETMLGIAPTTMNPPVMYCADGHYVHYAQPQANVAVQQNGHLMPNPRSPDHEIKELSDAVKEKLAIVSHSEQHQQVDDSEKTRATSEADGQSTEP